MRPRPFLPLALAAGLLETYILYEFLKAWDRIAAREAEKDPFFKRALDSALAYAGRSC